MWYLAHQARKTRMLTLHDVEVTFLISKLTLQNNHSYIAFYRWYFLHDEFSNQTVYCLFCSGFRLLKCYVQIHCVVHKATIYNLHSCRVIFLPRDATHMHSAVHLMALCCPASHHTPVYYRNDWTDGVGFRQTGFPQLILQCVIRRNKG